MIGQQKGDEDAYWPGDVDNVCLCVCYMFRHSSVCVQSKAARVLRHVSRVRVDQSSTRPILLSQPDLLRKTDPAPNTHHHHTTSHRHVLTFQPFKILRSPVVGIDHTPLQRHTHTSVTLTIVTMVIDTSFLVGSLWHFLWRCTGSSQRG